MLSRANLVATKERPQNTIVATSAVYVFGGLTVVDMAVATLDG